MNQNNEDHSSQPDIETTEWQMVNINRKEEIKELRRQCVGTTWKHYKGAYYIINGFHLYSGDRCYNLDTRSEILAGDIMVTYQRGDGYGNGDFYAQPWERFQQYITSDVKRFTRVVIKKIK